MHLDYSSAQVSRLLGIAAIARQEYTEARDFLEQAIVENSKHQRWTALANDSAWQSIVLRLLHCGDESDLRLRKSLETTLSTKSVFLLRNALPAAALSLAIDGISGKAVEIYELACTFPYVANAKVFEDVAGKRIAVIASSLPPAVIEAARAHGRERDPWGVVEELLAELEKEVVQG